LGFSSSIPFALLTALLILSPIIHPSTKQKGARYGIVIWLRDWNVAKLALLLGIAIIAGSTLDWDNLLQVMNGRIAVAILVMQIPLFGATLLNACRHSCALRVPSAKNLSSACENYGK